MRKILENECYFVQSCGNFTASTHHRCSWHAMHLLDTHVTRGPLLDTHSQAIRGLHHAVSERFVRERGETVTSGSLGKALTPSWVRLSSGTAVSCPAEAHIMRQAAASRGSTKRSPRPSDTCRKQSRLPNGCPGPTVPSDAAPQPH